MKLIALLMVRNESKILSRCLESLKGVVDAFCIHDTGSTDTTQDIAREFLQKELGSLTTSEWKDFGYNRTKSFQAAKQLVDSLGWDATQTYGLLLDADMVFVEGTLRKEVLTEVGYTLVQCAGNLEYPNCRLIRMDHNWVCRGVTHEYWDGPTKALPTSVAYIQDMNDGGCKADKFIRDAMLLERGLEEEPTNGRYMFYLGQTYNALARYRDAIRLYKKRIALGGWFEETWYCHYMIAQCYQGLEDSVRFEAWMLRAHQYRPERAEALYKLTKHFRQLGHHYKAYFYMLKGRGLSQPTDSLFLETDIYNGLFDYEKTILDFYVGKREEGLRDSMKYLLQKKDFVESVFSNLPFYITPLKGTIRNHPILHDVFGYNYHPTSTCVFNWKGRQYHNVRFVNYDIDHTNGSYMMKEGKYADHHKVRTQNAVWTPQMTMQMRDESVSLPRLDKRILGLEDVRVYTNKSGTLCFTATTAEYSDKIRVLQGEYDVEGGNYANCRVLESPTDQECEKNWIPINDTDDVIYRWHPLEIGSFKETSLSLHTSHSTPTFFRHLRGSAVPLRMEKELWCLVHFVEHTSPRKYYHMFVSLDAETYKPKAISLPFVFRSRTIEYCIGVSKTSSHLEFIFSTMDANPCVMEVAMDQMEWIQV